jgi:hypothetical protein
LEKLFLEEEESTSEVLRQLQKFEKRLLPEALICAMDLPQTGHLN